MQIRVCLYTNPFWFVIHFSPFRNLISIPDRNWQTLNWFYIWERKLRLSFSYEIRWIYDHLLSYLLRRKNWTILFWLIWLRSLSGWNFFKRLQQNCDFRSSKLNTRKKCVILFKLKKSMKYRMLLCISAQTTERNKSDLIKRTLTKGQKCGQK